MKKDFKLNLLLVVVLALESEGLQDFLNERILSYAVSRGNQKLFLMTAIIIVAGTKSDFRFTILQKVYYYDEREMSRFIGILGKRHNH